MQYDAEIRELENQLNSEGLSFIDKIELKDKILEIKRESGLQSKPVYDQIQCIGCSG